MRALVLVSAVAAALAAPASASAQCLASSEQQQFERAELVFVGIAMRGPNANGGRLLSPARFWVVRYLKGTGPKVVRVETGLRRVGRVLRGVSTGIDPRAGEPWKIFGARSRSGVVRTSRCTGSRRFGSIDTFRRLVVFAGSRAVSDLFYHRGVRERRRVAQRAVLGHVA